MISSSGAQCTVEEREAKQNKNEYILMFCSKVKPCWDHPSTNTKTSTVQIVQVLVPVPVPI